MTFHLFSYCIDAVPSPYPSEDMNDRLSKQDFISRPSVLLFSYFIFSILFCLVFPGRGFLHMADDPWLSALFNRGVLNSDWKLCVIESILTLDFIEGSD